jgi:membrane protease subunit (stomatin/prohibitin family)
MSLWDKLRGELIDIIEWTEPSQNDILAYRFPRYNNEIKMGAKLTVREGQAACFVNEGQLADVYQPGMYTLNTENMPILSTLKGWKYGFNSPFKAEVYFVSTRQWTDLKWGTQNPVVVLTIRPQRVNMARTRRTLPCDALTLTSGSRRASKPTGTVCGVSWPARKPTATGKGFCSMTG